MFRTSTVSEYRTSPVTTVVIDRPVMPSSSENSASDGIV